MCYVIFECTDLALQPKKRTVYMIFTPSVVALFTTKSIVGQQAEVTAADVRVLSLAVADLSARLERTNTKVNRHQKEIVNCKAHSMRHNLIISFDASDARWAEAQGENCAEKARTFMSQVLGLSAERFFITAAHRLGQRGRNTKPRPIIVSMPIDQEQQAVLKNTSRLRDTKHFISTQLPPSTKERKEYVIPEYLKKKALPNTTTKLFGDKLFVNGTVQEKFLARTLPPPTLVGERDAELATGDPIPEAGSVFRGFAGKVSSLQDVSDALATTYLRPELSDAKHISYAFRLRDARGATIEDFESDGDFGVGLELLKHPTSKSIFNTVIIAARLSEIGYQHIGSKCFKHCVASCSQAYAKLHM